LADDSDNICFLYLIIPLLGGKFATHAILKYAGWIVNALVLKNLLKRAQKGLRIRARDFLLLGVITVSSIFLWFGYPINFIMSSICILGFTFSYRARRNNPGSLIN
jgi:hypothetical protein